MKTETVKVNNETNQWEFDKFYGRAGTGISDEDASLIGPVLVKLAKAGKSDAYHILEEARNPDSPLHSHFTWDTDKAALQFNLAEARHIAAAIMVEIWDAEHKRMEKVRYLHAVTVHVAEQVKPKSTQRVNVQSENWDYKDEEFVDSGISNRPAKQYLTLPQIAKDSSRTDEVIEHAYRELQCWSKKYFLYKNMFDKFNMKFSKVFDTIEELEI